MSKVNFLIISLVHTFFFVLLLIVFLSTDSENLERVCRYMAGVQVGLSLGMLAVLHEDKNK